MRKIISGILCLAMLLSTPLIASAMIVDGGNEPDYDEPQNGYVDDWGDSWGDTKLIYDNGPTYSIVIPAEVNISKDTFEGVIDVEVVDPFLGSDMFVSVEISSWNAPEHWEDDDRWRLVNTEYEEDVIYYQVGTTRGDDDILNLDNVLVTQESAVSSLYVKLVGEPKFGKYVDYLTFTADIVKMFEFTIDGDTYYGYESMNWRQWANSEFSMGKFYLDEDGYLMSTDGKYICCDGGWEYYSCYKISKIGESYSHVFVSTGQ